MSDEAVHVAHPRLYGAPAYARPALSVASTLPPNQDDLPIAAEQTPEERAALERLLATPDRVDEGRSVSQAQPNLRPQPLLLSVLADRILRRAS